MSQRSDNSLATLLLVSRDVESSVPPLKAKEYWSLLANVEDPGQMLGQTEHELSQLVGSELAPRVAALTERARSLAFRLEELENQGTKTLSPFDDGYPQRLRDRLQQSAPPMLHAVGPTALLDDGGVGVVGSRDLTPAGVDVARAIAQRAANDGRTVISGGARGADRQAMQAAIGTGGSCVGVLADALVRTTNDVEVRRAIADEQLCLLTPYTPTAPFSVGNAMGRNKLIYALADVTVVVASDEGTGGTWAGATEALKRRYGRVAVWIGEGGGPGNPALVDLGATPLEQVDQLDTSPADEPLPGGTLTDTDSQLRLGI